MVHCVYRVAQKNAPLATLSDKDATIILPITSLNVEQFSKFFHLVTEQWICKEDVIKSIHHTSNMLLHYRVKYVAPIWLSGQWSSFCATLFQCPAVLVTGNGCTCGDCIWPLNFLWVGCPTNSVKALKALSGILSWLSVWSEVQMICILSSWCHCHLITCSNKIQNGLPS